MSFKVADIKSALEERGLLVGLSGPIPESLTGIADDSRKLERGNLFIAVKGWTSDGHDFLEAAAKRGAAMAIVEDASRTNLPALVVSEGRRAAAIAAAAAFANPAGQLRLLGVTGTNGKTTTTSIMRHLFDDGRSSSASIGTLGVLVGYLGEEDKQWRAENTVINRLLNKVHAESGMRASMYTAPSSVSY